VAAFRVSCFRASCALRAPWLLFAGVNSLAASPFVPLQRSTVSAAGVFAVPPLDLGIPGLPLPPHLEAAAGGRGLAHAPGGSVDIARSGLLGGGGGGGGGGLPRSLSAIPAAFLGGGGAPAAADRGFSSGFLVGSLPAAGGGLYRSGGLHRTAGGGRGRKQRLLGMQAASCFGRIGPPALRPCHHPVKRPDRVCLSAHCTYCCPNSPTSPILPDDWLPPLFAAVSDGRAALGMRRGGSYSALNALGGGAPPPRSTLLSPRRSPGPPRAVGEDTGAAGWGSGECGWVGRLVDKASGVRHVPPVLVGQRQAGWASHASLWSQGLARLAPRLLKRCLGDGVGS
jgi:hypothetical protein